jgi:hypothetical protein
VLSAIVVHKKGGATASQLKRCGCLHIDLLTSSGYLSRPSVKPRGMPRYPLYFVSEGEEREGLRRASRPTSTFACRQSREETRRERRMPCGDWAGGPAPKAGATEGTYHLVEPVTIDRSLLTPRWIQFSCWSGRVILDLPL